VNTAISRLNREFDLLREYCTRLTADVVTGKLDVREAAAHVPEEPGPNAGEDVADSSDEPDPAEEEAEA
jgi:type I restriction enzyme S subunit